MLQSRCDKALPVATVCYNPSIQTTALEVAVSHRIFVIDNLPKRYEIYILYKV